MSRHQASQIAAQGEPSKVVEVSTTAPAEDQVLVKAHAWAINPVDHVSRDTGIFIDAWPTIVGYDVAGVIVEVGNDVKSHKVGDRVLLVTTAGFQELVLAPAIAGATIPDALSFEGAAVVGLSAATAAAGLYQKEHLGLDLPSINPQANGKALLVWGAGSSVAASAIQLARASGYEVIATCSRKHFEYARKMLGASQVFDYKSPSVVEDISGVLREAACVGAYDAIGTQETQLAIATILSDIGGGKIASALFPLAPELVPANVETKTCWSMSNFSPKEESIAKSIFWDFLPQALSSGQFLPLPEPDVVGRGLGALQGAMNVHKAGVSARKIVVLA